ncbi:MAG: hypothetical protein C5B58_04310 [Acidobacteria bacterium]|nr:MAG: hypothetical protein C5B58_04310 [Acidobacteriota bacterium]
MVLVTLLAGSSFRVTEGELLRRSGSAFVVGTFVAALFLTFELLTDGAITRFVLNSSHVFHTLNQKHATAYNGQIVHTGIYSGLFVASLRRFRVAKKASQPKEYFRNGGPASGRELDALGLVKAVGSGVRGDPDVAPRVALRA